MPKYGDPEEALARHMREHFDGANSNLFTRQLRWSGLSAVQVFIVMRTLATVCNECWDRDTSDDPITGLRSRCYCHPAYDV